MDENILVELEGDAGPATAAIDEAIASLDGLSEAAQAVADTIDASLGGLEDTFASISSSVGGLDAIFGSLQENLAALSDSIAAASDSVDALGSSADAASTGIGALDAAAASATSELTGLSTSADTAAGSLDAARGSSEGFGGGMGNMTMPLLAAGAAVAGVGIGALKMASDYQSSMSVVQALTGQTAQQTQAFSQQVLAMSGQLGVPAKQLSDGLYYVLSAGVKASDAMGVLKVVTEASAAGMVDASTDADALTSAINAYGAGASQAQNYQDMLLVALRDGKTTMQELSSSIGRAAVTGNAAGFSFNQVAAAMSTMTLSGASAHIAGMQLSNLMRQVGINASTVATDAKKMGLSFDSTKFASMSLFQRLQYLQEITKGNKAEMLKLTGGAAGFQAAMMLLNQGGAQYTKILGDMAHSQGMTANAFAVHEQTMAAEWDHLKVAGENALIKLGDALEPLVKAIGDKILPALNKFSAWASAHPAAMRTAFLGIAAAVAAVATAFLAFRPVGGMISGVFNGMLGKGSTLGKLFLGLKGGMGSVVGEASRFGTAFGEGISTNLLKFGLAVRHPGLALDVLKGKLADLAKIGPNALSFIGKAAGQFGTFAGKLGDMAGMLGNPAQMLGLLRTGFMGAAQGALSAIPALAGMAASLGAILVPLLLIAGAIALGIIIFTRFHAQLSQVGGFLSGQMRPIFTDIHNTVQTFLAMVRLQWQATWPRLRPAVLDLINAFKSLSPVLQIVGTVISVVLKVILGLVSGVVGGFLSALPQIAGFFAAVFRLIGDFGQIIQAIFSGQWGKIPGIIGDGLRQIGLLVQNGLGFVLTFVGHTILSIVQWFDSLTGGALTGVVNFVKGVISFFEGLFDHLVGHSVIPDLVNGIIRWLTQTLPGEVLTGISNLVTRVIAWFAQMEARVLAAITAFVTGLLDEAVRLEVQFLNTITRMVDIALGWFDSMTSGAVSKAEGLVSRVVGVLTGLPGKIGSVMRGLIANMLGWGGDMIHNLASGITGALGTVTNAVGSVADKIKSFLHFSVPDEGPLADFDRWMPDMGDKLVQGLSAQQDRVKQAASGLAQAMQQGMAPTGALTGLAPSMPSLTAGGLGGNTGNVPSLLQQLITEVRGLGRAQPLGSNITPATLGTVVQQQIGNVNLQGTGNVDINTIYAIFNELAGLAVEYGGRGATAGMGI